MSDIVGGFACGDEGCHQITREQAEALWAAAMKAKAERAERMPDDMAAIRALTDAHHRLKELGWRDAIYAPTIETCAELELIEVGSSGIHRGYRDHEKRFWINDTDTWPSRPVLYREVKPASVSLPSQE